MITIGHAISSLCPEAQCAIDNDSYEGIRWFDDSTPKPSKQEIMAEVARLQVEETANAYKEQRAKAYPSIQEQLDMQYWDSVNGTTTWADAIAAVKQEFPKP
jgi:hypothetical protein